MSINKDAPVAIEFLQQTEEAFSIETGLLVLFGLKGHYNIQMDQGSVVLRAGDLTAVPPLHLYSLHGSTGAGLLKIRIDQSILRSAGYDGSESLECLLKEGGEEEAEATQIKKCCAALFRSVIEQRRASELRSRATELVTGIYDVYAGEPRDSKHYTAQNLLRVQAVLNAVKTNWRTGLSLKQMAEELYVSESYLSRIFRRYTGYSFLECLTSVRLGHAMTDLRMTEKSVTEIAYDNGFSNTNAFISFFRKQYHITPGTYRKQIHPMAVSQTEAVSRMEPADWAEALLRYDTVNRENMRSTRNVLVSVKPQGGDPIHRSWQEILNIGYANTGLLAPVQEQIRRAQKEIGFRFFRVKGILDDNMYIYHEDSKGNPSYNYVYADRLIDFILEEHALPMVEFSWIPSKLARAKNQFLERASIFAPPRDFDRWEEMIRALLQHWEERFGVRQMEHWRFTLPMYNAVELWTNTWTYKEYLTLYEATYRAVKSVSESFCFGGCGFYSDIALRETGALRLLRDIRDLGMLPDFLTIQCASHDVAIQDKDFLHFTRDQSSAPSVLSADDQFTGHFLEQFRNVMRQESLDHIPVIIEEWMTNFWQRDLSGDTLFRATWLCKNILQSYDRADALAYWLMTDWLDEWTEPKKEFHGGYGLLTQSGVAKAGYRALQMLSKIGTHRVRSGDGWFVAHEGEKVQVILYNYSHYEELYRLRYKRLEDPRRAYEVFQNWERVHYEIKLENMAAGRYLVQTESLTRMHGSAFDQWIQMGEPDCLSREDAAWLDQSSVPQRSVREKTVKDSALTLTADLDVHEVRMITISCLER